MEERTLLATFQVTNTFDSGAGSLRQAILNANQFTNLDTIQFGQLGAGQHLIQVNTPLPKITGPVKIDGATAQGYFSTPLVEIRRANPFFGVVDLHGLWFDTLDGGVSEVKALSITGFPDDGIRVANVDFLKVEDSYIGVTMTGLPRGNGDHGITFSGDNGSSDFISGNVISANGDHGIFLSVADGVQISGNKIGTNPAGTAAMPNGFDGINISASDGVTIDNNNVISGNAQDGIESLNTPSLKIENNKIGTNAAGASGLGNGAIGVRAQNSIGLTVDANVISDNGSHGVEILGSDGKNSSVINNKIGTDINGTSDLGNGGEGVYFWQLAHDNRVQSNTIAFNTGRGVYVATGAGSRNEISGDSMLSIPANSIFSNGGLGIDLGGMGVTANDNLDLDSGPNGLQNFPVLTKVDRDPVTGSTSIQGTLNSTPSRTFLIELFAVASPDASGHGEGKRFLQSTQVTTLASGNGVLNVSDSSLAPGEFVSATATTFDGSTFTRDSTSEFSTAVIVADVTVPTVMNVIVHHSANNHAEYTVSVGNGALQLKTVPVGGANQVKIIFSEQVTVAQNDLVLKGKSPSGVITTFAFGSFTQGAGPGGGQWFAEWTTTQSFGVNQMAILLESGASGVRDVAGNDLDGFWDNPVDLNDNTSDTFPSGNGGADDFVFSFTSLTGDAIVSNIVDIDDLNTVRNNFGMTGAKWADGDVTGDGFVNIDDLNEVRNNFGQTITASWDGSSGFAATSSGPVVGEEALRSFLVDLLLTMRATEGSDESSDGLFRWELLGDAEWWNALADAPN